MIKGIGNDLVEVNRIEKAMKIERFLNKYFTKKENELFKKRNYSPQVVAGNFGVKESVAKAFGCGFREIKFREIEVLRDEVGKPYVNLYGKAKVKSSNKDIKNIHVTISNTNGYISAFVVLE